MPLSSEKKVKLLKEIFRLKNVLLVIGGRRSVSELALKKPKVSFHQGWATCECRDWHIHLKVGEIEQVKFVEEPSHCEAGKMSYSIRLLSSRKEPLLRAYFSKLYDKKTGRFIPSRLRPYRKLQRRYH